MASPGEEGQHNGGLFAPLRRREPGQYLPFSPCDLGAGAWSSQVHPAQEPDSLPPPPTALK